MLYFCSMRIVLPLNRNLLSQSHYTCTYILSTLFHHPIFTNMYFFHRCYYFIMMFSSDLTMVCIVEFDIFGVIVFYLLREETFTYYGEVIVLFLLKSGFPPIREFRENFEDFFQSGKSGKNLGFSAKIREKISNQGTFFPNHFQTF